MPVSQPPSPPPSFPQAFMEGGVCRVVGTAMNGARAPASSAGLPGSLDAHPCPEPGLETLVASTEPPLTSSPLYFDFFFFFKQNAPVPHRLC